MSLRILSPIAVAATSLTLPATAQQLLQNFFGAVAGGELGRVVRAVGDHDGDSVPDFLVTQPETQTALPGRAFVISGATRAVLMTFVGAPIGTNRGFGYYEATALGDLNGDGRRDFAIGYSPSQGPLDVFSGSNGTRLYRLGGSPPPDYSPFACPIDDHDGDGRPDLVALTFVGGSPQLWIVRGTNGTQLGVLDTNPGNTGPLRNLGDLDGNGRPEIGFLNSSSGVQIYRLSPPGLVRTLPRPANAGTLRAMEAVDLTGDGIAEVLVADDTRLFAFTATNGSVLRTYQLAGGLFTVVGDLDADQVPDLVLANGNEVMFASGATGRRLSVWSSDQPLPIGNPPMAGVGDLDGDGFGDLLLGVPGHGPNAGAWQLVSGRILAATQSQPSNCGGGPFLPELGMTRPVLGQNVTLVGRDCPPGALGTVALSGQPPFSFQLGVVGCNAWFDVGNWVILHQPPLLATWTTTLRLPNAPQLAGLEVALQAFYVPTGGPLGFDLSNGIWARLGY